MNSYSSEVTSVFWYVDDLKNHYYDRYLQANEVREEAERLTRIYDKYLRSDLITSAFFLCWNQGKTVRKYQTLFLTNVLMRAYHVFDKTHRNYYGILEIMKKENPEWVHAFERRHEELMEIAKIHKKPIYIGTQ